ncbi:hypothetical protein FNF27_07693 [Cafeteria roenbergensis]|uniref:Uncharacterized protein n=1 Tax=Cafeteria roenbergensis TaxID=33653 RepID=A0A5A8DIM6_CAFRO|nr:hypothetical protein FNF27_07693 [Cafeteria roenbergensis]
MAASSSEEMLLWAGVSAASIALMVVLGLGVGMSRMSAFVDKLEKKMDARVESRLGRLARAEGGLIACITGANAGIGLELATRLAVCGVHVVMLCRSEKRGKEAVAVVRSACLAETGMAPAAPVQLVQCDVSEPAAVRACAAALAAALPRIDLLYLNAGTMPVEGYNWASLIRAATTDQPLLGGPPEGGITHFFETGRGSATGEHFLVNPRWAREPSADHAGAPHLLATHVLGHVLLVELCAKNGLIGRGRVPELGADSKPAALERSDALSDAPWLASPPKLSRAPSFPEGAPCDPDLWLRPDSGCGGGGARVVWTSSRAANLTTDVASLRPEGLACAPEAEAARAALDAYGEAKFLQDALCHNMQRRLREGLPASAAGAREGSFSGTGDGAPTGPAPDACVTAVCPGFVATALTPWFMQLGLPFLELVRPSVCGQQLTARRGISPHLAVAIAAPSVTVPGRKLVVHRGMLTAAANGQRAATEEEQQAATEVCDEWLARWSSWGR